MNTTPDPASNISTSATSEPLDQQAIIRLTFELAQMREEARHGWLRVGENLESIAEHTQRAAVLGYLLAHAEGFEDPNLVATMILFHDMHEVRTGDRDLVHKQYLEANERAALADQVAGLGMVGATIQQMWEEVETGSTRAGTIAKDAEVLEMAFAARELVVRGNLVAQVWIDSVRDRLKTRSAQEMLEILNTADPYEWWRTLCKQ